MLFSLWAVRLDKAWWAPVVEAPSNVSWQSDRCIRWVWLSEYFRSLPQSPPRTRMYMYSFTLTFHCLPISLCLSLSEIFEKRALTLNNTRTSPPGNPQSTEEPGLNLWRVQSIQLFLLLWNYCSNHFVLAEMVSLILFLCLRVLGSPLILDTTGLVALSP